MKIVSIHGKDQSNLKRIQDMLEVFDDMRDQIVAGEISEFVAASIAADGQVQIHVSSLDLPGSIGLFEIGKHILISQEC